MVKIELDLKKSLEENAASYFDQSKACRKKIENIKRAILSTGKKLGLAQKKATASISKKLLEKKRKRNWFEKFHWFYTSNNFLVFGGKDAHSNEQVVKKHMSENDLYFHADIFGAPHCVLKTDGKIPDKSDLIEAACFAGLFSKAWQDELPSVDVYSVKPEQVSKKAPSGESVGTGAFMIYGKKLWFKKSSMDFSIGLEKIENGFRIISGPKNAIKSHAVFSIDLIQGKLDKNVFSKKLKQLLELKSLEKIFLEDIQSLLPAGKFDLKN